MKKLFLVFFSCCLISFIVSGCDNNIDTNYVEGVVKLDGQPLPGASVTFIPVAENGESAGGFSDDSGLYRLTSTYGKGGKGALTGDYIVIVTKSKSVPLEKPITYDDGSVTTETTEHILPAIYRDRTKSPLKFSVVEGKNRFDIDLSAKP
ncbi:MAG: DUF4198 domain-containing protein [Planctomycetaceae bacterium]|jgi:hypothetical protein|nr:DUF4198 domain-containing protein [Planctomycetaceae bacterium]